MSHPRPNQRRISRGRTLLIFLALFFLTPAFLPVSHSQSLNPPIQDPPPPPLPPPGKEKGDHEGGSDESNEPSPGEMNEGGGDQDSGSNESGDGSYGGGNDDDKCKPPPPPPGPTPPPSCIKETIALAFAANDGGMASGVMQLFIDAASANMASRSYIDFFGIPYMAVTAINDLGAKTRYTTIQGDGSSLVFEIAETQPPGGGYIAGYPVGGGASNLARVTFVTATGQPASKTGATYLRQYRDRTGYVDFPLLCGFAARFVTTEGRTYNLPFAGIETIRQRTDGSLIVNGAHGNGVIRQARTLAGLIDVVPLGERSYEVRKYAPQQVGPKDEGLYTANGDPIESMRVEAPAGTSNQLVITKQMGSRSAVTTHTVTTNPATGEQWVQAIQMGDFGLVRELRRAPDPAQGAGYATVTRKARLTAAPGVQGPAPEGFDYVFEATVNQHAPLQTKETFRTGPERLRSRAYSPPAWDSSGVGRATTQSTSTGTQITYGIDPATQRMQWRRHQFQIPAGAGGSSPVERREDYDYAPLAAGEEVAFYDFRPRMTTVSEDGQAVSLRFASYRTANGEYLTTIEDVPGLAANFGDAANRRTEQRYYGPGANQGRLREEQHADGTLTRHEYQLQANGTLIVTTLKRLSPEGTAVSGHSTRSIVLRDVRGWPVETTRAHWVDGAWLDFETMVETYNLAGNLTSRLRRDLLSATERMLLEQEWDGDLLMRRVDERGVAIRSEYFAGSDLVQREIREAIPALGDFPAQPEMVTTYSGSFQLDQNQSPVWQTKVATTTAGNLTLSTTTAYDEQGRVIEQTDANGYTALTTYSAGDQVVSVTLPSGGTQITRRTSGGDILSITGTAIVPQFFHRAPRAAGGRIETIFLAQDNGPRWTRTERDGAGRIAVISAPAFGGGVAQAIYHYDEGACACGKPSKITRTGLPATVFAYNAVHEAVRTGSTGDDETLSLDSQTDRIQDDVTTAELDGTRLWLVRRQSVYPESGNATAKTVKTTRKLVGGFTGTEFRVTETADLAGNVSREIVEVDRAARLETRRAVSPSATDAGLAVLHAGRLVLAHRPGSSGDITYVSDALGRLQASHDPGHANPQTQTYETGKDRLASETDPAGNTTSYTYVPPGQPGAGSIQTVTAPDNGVTTTEYNLHGRVVKTYGARTYPVAHGYNAFGDRETLTTWQDYAGSQGEATTQWTYDAATGLLTAKTDAANKSVSYTYDPARRLLTRTWARGVVTTYGYNPLTADLASVNYSDTTPDVALTYDRLGRQLTATANGVAQSVFTYRADTLQIVTETVRQDLDGNGTFDFQRIFTRSQDTLLRSTGFSLAAAGLPAETAVTYGYESVAGRFASVTLPDARAFTYAYDAARPHLLATVTGPAHRVVNTWEPNRDILDIKSNQTLTGTDLSRYDYTVNGIGQRTAVGTTGTAFTLLGGGAGQDRGWTWGYDALGQLITATHASIPANHRGYEYDDIGNREHATEPTVTTDYTTNLLNQYTTVTIGGSTVNPTFDDDGNQLSAALGQAAGKTFEWDGENRLKAVKDAGGAVVVSYTYDHASRRIRRSGAEGGPLFVYDGWNLVAEYSAVEGTVNLTKIHTWGLDLSGTLQGGGGVGGLLVSETPSDAVTYPAYDGNGNLTVLVDGTGAVSGVYEYDPYGNVMASAGAAAAANAFRFSNKPQDLETGWLYYGYRWYDPFSGRWTSRDPIEEEGGWNLYGFLSNALNTTADFAGLASCASEADLGNADYILITVPRKASKPPLSLPSRKILEEGAKQVLEGISEHGWKTTTGAVGLVSAMGTPTVATAARIQILGTYRCCCCIGNRPDWSGLRAYDHGDVCGSGWGEDFGMYMLPDLYPEASADIDTQMNEAVRIIEEKCLDECGS